MHRDLKPANIKVTRDGKVKVLDFGLSLSGFMTFFGYRDYDFMPDGVRLVMVFPTDRDDTPEEQFVTRVNVVVNWVEELKERLALP